MPAYIYHKARAFLGVQGGVLYSVKSRVGSRAELYIKLCLYESIK